MMGNEATNHQNLKGSTVQRKRHSLRIVVILWLGILGPLQVCRRLMETRCALQLSTFSQKLSCIITHNLQLLKSVTKKMATVVREPAADFTWKAPIPLRYWTLINQFWDPYPVEFSSWWAHLLNWLVLLTSDLLHLTRSTGLTLR